MGVLAHKREAPGTPGHLRCSQTRFVWLNGIKLGCNVLPYRKGYRSGKRLDFILSLEFILTLDIK